MYELGTTCEFRVWNQKTRKHVNLVDVSTETPSGHPTHAKSDELSLSRLITHIELKFEEA